MCYNVYSGKVGLSKLTPKYMKAGDRMPIKFDKLITILKERGITTYKIRKENLISQATYQKLRTGDGIIDTRTIEKLCKLLDCQPGDIMEYVEGDEK